MKKGIFLLLALLSFMAISCQQQSGEIVNEYNIVPRPNTIKPQKGRFELNNQVKVITAGLIPEVKIIADSLIERIRMVSGITLQHTEELVTPAIKFVEQDGMPKEGYKLSVTPEQVTITASEPNGFFYGVQSVYQLLPPVVYGKNLVKRADWSIPAVEIEDAPRFRHRGLMLDVCRHFSTKEYVYKFIDMLAMHKMNIFHFHLTDDQGWRIEIKKYPKLIEVGSKREKTMIDYYFVNYPLQYENKEHSGHFTQEEIKEIVAYAASKYITVVPEIEMPGHAIAALAAYPELSCFPEKEYKVSPTWGIFEEVFCPKEETFAFLEGVLDEVIELFPSEYIHIGGDECPKTAWEKCEHCQQLIKKLGLKDDVTPNPVDGIKHTKEEKLQSYFITRMEKYLNGKGRNIIGWDEILEGGIAPNATVMSWRGIQGGLNAAKAGHDAIMTPNPYLYLDQYQEEPAIAPATIGGFATLKKVYSYNPVPDDADELVKKHIIGLQGNTWTEYMQNDGRRDYQVFPRASAVAEIGWTLNENKDWEDFCIRMVEDFERMEVMNVKPCTNFYEVHIKTRADEGSLKVELESYYPGAEIRYTTDGTVPTKNSVLYTQPFTLSGNMEVQAGAFKNGKLLGNIRTKSLYGNLIGGKKYTVTPDAGWMRGDIVNEYDILGADTITLGLTNGKRGNPASYTPWVSFNLNGKDVNQVVFTVTLDEIAQVKTLIFGSLFNPAYQVLPPSSASVELSIDGKDYIKVTEKIFERQLPETGRVALTDMLNFEPTEARYIRLTLQSGGTLTAGINYRVDKRNPYGKVTPSNMLLDEVEVY